MSLETPRIHKENDGEQALRSGILNFLGTVDKKLSVTKLFALSADKRDFNEEEGPETIVHIDHPEHPNKGLSVRFENMQQLENEVKKWYDDVVRPAENREEYKKAA